MKNNLENIPAMLRVIAREIEKGNVAADIGVLSLRKKGSAYPTVYGFGPVGKIDPVAECGRAAVEILRLAGVPRQSRETVNEVIDAIEKIVCE
jgi:hypothetical protein